MFFKAGKPHKTQACTIAMETGIWSFLDCGSENSQPASMVVEMRVHLSGKPTWLANDEPH